MSVVARVPIRARVSGSVVALAFAAGACASLPGNQGDTAAPIVVRGTMFNRGGAPYAVGHLELQVHDDRNVPVGQPAPLAFEARFTSSMDGTFALHVAPTPALRDLAAAAGGAIDFELIGTFPGDAGTPSMAFSRQLDAAGWSGAIPSVELRQPPLQP